MFGSLFLDPTVEGKVRVVKLPLVELPQRVEGKNLQESVECLSLDADVFSIKCMLECDYSASLTVSPRLIYLLAMQVPQC
jgi:hypothetical protein